jgi:hypothetical protein
VAAVVALVCFLLLTSTAVARVPSTQLVSVGSSGEPANGVSYEPTLGHGGRVAWTSLASNLAPGDGNGLPDVFARRAPFGSTQLVSGLPGGAAGAQPDITSNGRYVAFVGGPQVYVRDLVTGRLDIVSVSSSGADGNGASTCGTASMD